MCIKVEAVLVQEQDSIADAEIRRVTVPEVVRCGELREEVMKQLMIDEKEREQWVVEKYDDDFSEWVDLDEEEEVPSDQEPEAVKLRLTKQRPPGDKTDLEKLQRNLEKAEEDLHHMIHQPDHLTELLSSPADDASPSRYFGSIAFDLDDHKHLDLDQHQTDDSHVAEDIAIIDTDRAYSLYTSGNGTSVFFIDVRGKDEAHQTGMISGAIRCHKGLLEWCTDSSTSLFTPALLSGKNLVLYASGNVTEGGRPEFAARTLSSMGIPHVLVLKEGLTKWKERNLPISYEESSYPTIEPIVQLTKTAHDMVLEATKGTQFITVHAASELVDNNDIVFVDVRSQEEVEETGVIPGAAIANRELIEWYSNPASQSVFKLFNPLFGSGKRLIIYGGGLVGGGRPILVSATIRKVLPYHSNVSVLEGGFTEWVSQGHPTEPVDTFAAPESPPTGVCSEIMSVATFFPRRSISGSPTGSQT